MHPFYSLQKGCYLCSQASFPFPVISHGRVWLLPCSNVCIPRDNRAFVGQGALSGHEKHWFRFTLTDDKNAGLQLSVCILFPVNHHDTVLNYFDSSLGESEEHTSSKGLCKAPANLCYANLSGAGIPKLVWCSGLLCFKSICAGFSNNWGGMGICCES